MTKAKTLGILLRRIERHYKREVPKIEAENAFIYEDVAKGWFANPTNCTTSAKVLWYDNDQGSIETEISEKIYDGDSGYFDHIENTFVKHLNFIKSEFPSAINLYKNDVADAEQLIRKLHTTVYQRQQRFHLKHFGEVPEIVKMVKMNDHSKNLSKKEFLKAIQFDVISNFIMMEKLYCKYNYKYQPLLSDEYFVSVNVPYIQILDKSREDEIIKLIYDKLIEYDIIEGSYSEFHIHFTPQYINALPIKWKGNNILLMHLLDLLKSESIVHKSTSVPKLLIQHFCNKKNLPFSPKSISSKYSNIASIQKSRGIEDIQNIIDAIQRIGK